ncbi:hypothetical protein V8C42DRAFT_142823 [Trichoderma barbatum]
MALQMQTCWTANATRCLALVIRSKTRQVVIQVRALGCMLPKPFSSQRQLLWPPVGGSVNPQHSRLAGRHRLLSDIEAWAANQTRQRVWLPSAPKPSPPPVPVLVHAIPTVIATSSHRLAVEGWAPTLVGWLRLRARPSRGDEAPGLDLPRPFSLTYPLPPLAVICHQTQMQYSTFAYSSPSYFTGRHGDLPFSPSSNGRPC